MSRKRISLVKENRIWDLRCQGYSYEAIANIVASGNQLTPVIRRVRQRLTMGRERVRGWLSDSQVENIREMARTGHTYLSIGRKYGLQPSTIGAIVRERTYREPCNDKGFVNRLTQPRETTSYFY